MRVIPALALILGMGVPSLADAQSVAIHASGGPTLVDRGYSLAGGVAWLPLSRLSVGVNLERTHLFTRERGDGRSTSTFRGGTVTVGTAELQLSLFPRDRVTPYPARRLRGRPIAPERERDVSGRSHQRRPRGVRRWRPPCTAGRPISGCSPTCA